MVAVMVVVVETTCVTHQSIPSTVDFTGSRAAVTSGSDSGCCFWRAGVLRLCDATFGRVALHAERNHATPQLHFTCHASHVEPADGKPHHTPHSKMRKIAVIVNMHVAWRAVTRVLRHDGHKRQRVQL